MDNLHSKILIIAFICTYIYPFFNITPLLPLLQKQISFKQA